MAVHSFFLRSSLPAMLMAATALMPFSCSRKVADRYDSIPLVNALVSDSLPALQGLAAAAGKVEGSIVIIGEPGQCMSVGEEILSADNFDNIDGRQVPDGLPDFAGETISMILDRANAPYGGYVGARNTVFLRETIVRQALAAIDTVCSKDRYYKAGKSRKTPAKLLVVCSPLLSRIAAPDVKDIFEKIGCDVPVISSDDTAFSYSKACYSLLRERNMFTHDISYPAVEIFSTFPSRSMEIIARTDSTGGFTEEYKYSRPQGETEPTFTLVRQTERKIYVSDKYQP